MKIKHQLSIATLVMVGFFATGCSQQTADGGSQVSGGSQQAAGESQVAGGSQQQVEGGTQVAGGSQQQVEEPAVVKTVPVVKKPAVVPAPVKRTVRHVAPKPRRSGNRWTHYHPEAPKCAKTRQHTHKYKMTGARHHHRYACAQPRRQQHYNQPRPTQRVDVRALQTKLKAKGFYKGPIDGIVGPGTRSALKRFMNR